MKFSENWLREFVDPGVGRNELLQRLTMAGLEVESVEALGAELDGVVIARITSADPHPDADRLRVCQVDAGGGETLQIVCGAPNARAGLKVPLARVGSVLPGGLKIGTAKLRGVDSSGMLCSARELELSEDASGLMELAADAPVGQPLAAWLGLPDATIELKMTPNRSDCLGLWGLAHDVAAVFGTRVKPRPQPVITESSERRLDIELESPSDCPRYLGRWIEDMDPSAASPLWMQETLRRCGLRSISAIVDVTNYVMLELGQPLHAFNAESIAGGIRVRRALPGETLRLLDEREVELDPEFLVIADHDKALAVAGVMGGWDSRVTDSTRQVFLESAHFAPDVIMGRARRLGMHTDASHRFERGVDPEMPRLALERTTELLLQIAGGRAGAIVEAVNKDALPRRKAVSLRRERLASVLGMRISDNHVSTILKALGMEVSSDAEGWRVTPPSRRFDIAIEEDLIEEIARAHGYDHVPLAEPDGVLDPVHLPEATLDHRRLRDRLTARGYQEAITYTFVAEALLQQWSLVERSIALANPLSRELAVMRTSLLPGLVEALRHNRNRQQQRVRLCELGSVYLANDTGHDEPQRIAAVACGSAAPESWGQPRRSLDFHDIKGDVEALLALGGAAADYRFEPSRLAFLHPGRSADVIVDGVKVGYLGALHPALLAKLDLRDEVYVLELELDQARRARLPVAHALPRFPSIRRDLALLLPASVAYDQVAACLHSALGSVLREVRCFDLYAGSGVEPGHISLAIGLILQDTSRTLTDGDADLCVQQGMEALKRQFEARLRG